MGACAVSDAQLDIALDGIATTESLRSLGEQFGCSAMAVLRALHDRAPDRYLRAREARGELDAAEVKRINDMQMEIAKRLLEGDATIDAQRASVASAALDRAAGKQQWLAACRSPRWSPKQQTELSGPGGGPIAVAGIDVASITPEQLRALASIKLAGE